MSPSLGVMDESSPLPEEDRVEGPASSLLPSGGIAVSAALALEVGAVAPLAPQQWAPVPESPMAVPTDPALNPASSFYSWHLVDSDGINVMGAWADYTGNGVKVAVLDDGFAHNLSDLSPNYRTDLDYDTLGNDNDALNGPADTHGTYVSTFIAADDNGSGLVGVAFDSDLVGIRRGFGAETSIQDTLEGFQHTRTVGADVMNNSWGSTAAFGDHFGINFMGTDYGEVGTEMINLVNLGRGGLGTSIVFSAGNSRADGDNVNYKNFQNSPYVITVGATDINGDVTSFSTPGAAILVSAPGQNVRGYHISGNVSGTSGTSFSAPIVSGVIALMYEANTDLGYRDVMDILALSSRKTDPNDASWQDNGATNWNGGGMHFSHDYGFGLVDATAAVRLAETWQGQQTYTNMTRIDTATSSPNLSIPATGTVNATINVAQDIEIEKILIDLDISHARAGDLIVTLVSPDGTESVLVNRIENGAFVSQYGITGIDFQMSTNASWGEGSSGTWTLRIEDVAGGNAGTLNNWSLSFLGNALPTNDLYIYSDEFANASGGRLTLTDSDGGSDTINAAMVTGDMTINLNGGNTSTIAGNTLTIAAGTVIEKLYGGDGNDSVTGNATANEIHGGRGNDVLSGGGGGDTLYGDLGSDTLSGNAGNDVLDGGAGSDTALYAITADDFDFTFVNPTTVTVTHRNGGSEGVDTLVNIENFTFNGVTYDRAGLEAYVAARSAIALPIALIVNLGGSSYSTTSSSNGVTNLTAAQMNYGGSSGNQFRLTRSGDSLTVDILSASAPPSMTIRAANDGDTITVNGTHATFTAILRGGSGDDVLASNVGNADQLFGFGGNDILSGGGGNDRLDGGDGNDSLNGGAGADTMLGGNGDDTLNGDADNDMLYGGAGNDAIHGGSGADRLYGQDGNDSLNGGADNDLIYGGNGNDTLNGDDGNDTLYGDAGTDILNGGTGADILYGGADNDTLYGDAGADRLFGGLGNDTLRGGEDNDILRGEDGNDTLYGDAGTDQLYGGLGDDVLYGGSGNDSLFGDTGNDTLRADADNDLLRGGNGDDTLILGAGLHTAYGDAGMDTYGWAAMDGGIDKIYGFSALEGDKLNLTDILSGFAVGVSDIDDFVRLVYVSTSRTDLRIDADGGGDSFATLATINANLSGVTAQGLYDTGRLIVDQSLI